jgi:hypothetical protein
MQILPCAQGSPEWVEAKLGLASASNFKRIMTPATQQLSTQATDYACELIAERMTGGKDPWKWQGETADMQRGTYTESEARKWFQLEHDTDVEQVGLVIHDNGRWCASPDGLLGTREGLELKCPAPKTQVRWLSDGIVPVEHLPQVHGALIVTGRERWWFMSYCVGMPPLLLYVEPNAYTEALRGYLEEFNVKYDELWAKIQARLQSHIDAEIDRRQNENPKELRSFVA